MSSPHPQRTHYFASLTHTWAKEVLDCVLQGTCGEAHAKDRGRGGCTLRIGPLTRPAALLQRVMGAIAKRLFRSVFAAAEPDGLLAVSIDASFSQANLTSSRKLHREKNNVS